MEGRIQKVAMVIAAMMVFCVGSARTATTITYTYDDLNRLVAAVRSDGPSLEYAYDEAGNITLRTSVNPDSDADGLKDIEESGLGTDPFQADADQDGLSDYEEACFDGDCTTYSPYDRDTNPGGGDLNSMLSDTDGDGVPDGQEVALGSNPLDSGSVPGIADGDLDGDGALTMVDVFLAQRILTGTLAPTLEQLRRGDVAPLVGGVSRPDGEFNAADLLIILRMVQDQAVP